MIVVMKVVTLTSGGQVSIPAEYRRGWTTRRVMVRETSDGLLLTPMPDDPLAAAAGSLKHRLEGITSDELRQQVRDEETASDDRKWGYLARR